MCTDPPYMQGGRVDVDKVFFAVKTCGKFHQTRCKYNNSQSLMIPSPNPIPSDRIRGCMVNVQCGVLAITLVPLVLI